MSVDVEPVNHIKFVNSEHDKYRTELELRVKDFLAENAVKHVLGITGDGDDKLLRVAEKVVEEFVEEIKGKDYAILTGGTEGGIPELGTKIAKRLDVPRIGVFPKQGEKYALFKDLDIAIEATMPDVGDGLFGAETPTFVNLLDGATVLGGSYGTLVEVTTILKTNVKRIKDKTNEVEGAREPIYFAPVYGTGGAADMAYNIAGSFGRDVEKAMPENYVVNGMQAAQFLQAKLRRS